MENFFTISYSHVPTDQEHFESTFIVGEIYDSDDFLDFMKEKGLEYVENQDKRIIEGIQKIMKKKK